MTREDLGKIAYEAACKVTGCTQPWAEANQEKWIAAGVATYFAGMRSAQDLADARAEHWLKSEKDRDVFRHHEATAISEWIDKAVNLGDN